MKSTNAIRKPKPQITIKQQQTLKQDKKTSRSLSSFTASTQKYLELMDKLLSKMQINKVRKILKEIKRTNAQFREYFNENRIANLRIQDVIKFEDQFEKAQSEGNINVRRNAVMELIRRGFQALLRKMEECEVTDFQMQIRYCNSTVEREMQKLCCEYEGIGLVRNSYFHTAEIEQDERQNGRYEFLRENEVKKSAILQNCQLKFRSTLFGK